jgi:hypothetical protein
MVDRLLREHQISGSACYNSRMKTLREVQAKEARLPNGMAMIYALADPATLDVRYVGQTRSPGRRRWLHRSRTSNQSGRMVCRWIRGLLCRGLAPVMLEIEIVTDPDEAEGRWVAEYHRRGAKLLNMNSGGQAMEQCFRADGVVSKGSKLSPLHVIRKFMSETPADLRRVGAHEAAKRVELRSKAMDEAVERLAKRMGKKGAYAYINEQLAKRNPQRWK